MSKQKIRLLTVLAVSLFLVGAGCNTTSNNNEPAAAATSEGLPVKGEVKSFTIIASQYKFEPGTIIIKKGDTVRLTLTSKDVEHSFVLREFNVNVDLPPGKTQSIEFVADKTGTFTFRCWVYCGDGHSEMAGRLVVQ